MALRKRGMPIRDNEAIYLRPYSKAIDFFACAYSISLPPPPPPHSFPFKDYSLHLKVKSLTEKLLIRKLQSHICIAARIHCAATSLGIYDEYCNP